MKNKDNINKKRYKNKINSGKINNNSCSSRRNNSSNNINNNGE